MIIGKTPMYMSSPTHKLRTITRIQIARVNYKQEHPVIIQMIRRQLKFILRYLEIAHKDIEGCHSA